MIHLLSNKTGLRSTIARHTLANRKKHLLASQQISYTVVPCLRFSNGIRVVGIYYFIEE